VLLTRSPLGLLPEGRASLDLHVLSTPPAFVLSQDQTLRECLYDYPASRDCRHRKSPSWRRFQSLVIRAGCFICSMYQRNLFTSSANRRCRRELINGTNFRHAVEFSRSGRTPLRPFRTDPGQPTLRYSVGSARSTDRLRPIPTWSPHTNQPWRAALGGFVRPAPSRLRSGFPAAPGGSVRRTRRRLVSCRDARQVVPVIAARPAFAGVPSSRQGLGAVPRSGWKVVIRTTARGFGAAHGPSTRFATLRFPEATRCPTSSSLDRSYRFAGTPTPSIRTAPASISRRAALVLADSPAATSNAGR
jgi:hypothetical protein